TEKGEWRQPKLSASSVLRERVVRIAVQPPLAGFGRSYDGMLRRLRVLRRMAIGGVIAAVRAAALLAGAQMHPRAADLHTLVADALLCVLDVGDGLNVRAGVRRAHRSSSFRSHLPRDAPAS